MGDREQEYREVIPELFRIQREFDGGKIRSTHVKVAHVAHGWYRRVVRGVAALLTLEEAGFVGEAPPLRRSIIEHNVGLSWVAEEGDKILDPIMSAHKATTELLTRIKNANWTEDDLAKFQDVLESVGSPDKSKDFLRHFDHRTALYGTPSDYVQFVIESGLSHATYESGVAYYDPATKEVTEHAERVINQALFAASHLGLGIANFMRIFEDPPKDRVLAFAEVGIRMREIDRRYRLENGLPVPEEYGEDENSPIPGMWDAEDNTETTSV